MSIVQVAFVNPLINELCMYVCMFFASCISASRVQHISVLHSKFTLGLHHVWKYGRHPISDRWD